MIKQYHFNFCKMSVYEDYILTVINEGITVSVEHNDVLLAISEKHFSGKNFVYITHRINSYSVNPNVYLKTSQIKNLQGFAVISDNPLQDHQVQLEKKFFNKPFEKFNTLGEALVWKNTLLHGIMPFKK